MTKSFRILVAVGSRKDQVCSIGAFARAEMKALASVGQSVQLCEPTARWKYPVRVRSGGESFDPDIILYHAPSLIDRGKPTRPFMNLVSLRMMYPKAKLVSVVHEFSEAPLHWKLRQAALLQLSSAAVVNSVADERESKKFLGKAKKIRKVPMRRIPLGPTLFDSELEGLMLKEKDQNFLYEKINRHRAIAEKTRGIPADKPWLLHPGLLTPGKGLNVLAEVARQLLLQIPDASFVIMGGKGPKESDRVYAEKALAELRALLGRRLFHIDSPSDEEFQTILTAADVVLLPYDDGVSERRSSFLSTMTCAANVVSSRGRFTKDLDVEDGGAYFADADDDSMTEQFSDLAITAVKEGRGDGFSISRRIKNVRWAASRSWAKRTHALLDFFSSLK